MFLGQLGTIDSPTRRHPHNHHFDCDIAIDSSYSYYVIVMSNDIIIINTTSSIDIIIISIVIIITTYHYNYHYDTLLQGQLAVVIIDKHPWTYVFFIGVLSTVIGGIQTRAASRGTADSWTACLILSECSAAYGGDRLSLRIPEHSQINCSHERFVAEHLW